MSEDASRTATNGTFDEPLLTFVRPSSATGKHDFTLGICGSGGDGVVTAGELAEGALSSRGMYCMLTKSFGPQIRGGECYSQLRACDAPIATDGDALDMLVVFSWKDYRRFKDEVKLRAGTILLHDPDDKSAEGVELPVDETHLKSAILVPFEKLAKGAGSAKNKNMVMLGVASVMVGIPRESIEKKIRGRFGRKGDDVVGPMLKAFEAGYSHAESEMDERALVSFMDVEAPSKCLMTGNDAVGFGALWAGCRFFAGYPITPSTEVMHFAAKYLPRYGGRVIQVEDEMAAVGLCVGASFAGVKSMTATSGPGLSLMMEIIGLASIAELPLVICDVQRVGPSTGIPTKSEQSDLLHACFGGHGDAYRVVLAPCDVEDCFDTTVKAFYIAERYQMPVLILSDQTIGQRKESIDPKGVIDELQGFVTRNERRQPDKVEEGWRRYDDTHDDMPVITIPGTKGGTYQISGLEHDERGRPTSTYHYHEKMAARRKRRIERVAQEFKFLRRYGPEDADVGIIAWGSSKGPVKDAVFEANASGKKVAALIPQILYPLPTEQILEFIASVKRLAVMELSANAQFLQLLKTGLELPKDVISFARPGANQLRAEEVHNVIAQAYEGLESK